jgi:FkbH-like protein
VSDRHLRLVSDFNASILARYLENISNDGKITVAAAPYDQVYKTLSHNPGDTVWGSIVWTLVERVIPTFSQAIHFQEVDHARCMEEVDAFADGLISFANHQQHNFVVSWLLPPGYRGYGMLEWRPGLGLANLIAKMNLHLAERLAPLSNTYLLDASRWVSGVSKALSPKMWYAAKVPYANQVFELAAHDLFAALRAVSGKSRRLIILDLDDTLWGGVVGETGWEGIRLGGHDHVGEAYRDFQNALLALCNRGIQLAIVSKNDESVAFEAINQHPEMLLRKQHFAGWRINWQDKVANIEALAQELNVGFSSIVLIDDNPAERERVSRSLPDLLVPEWPADPTAYVNALRAMDCFDTASLTLEDRRRTVMYVAERERRDVKAQFESYDTWLRHLGTTLRVDTVNPSNTERVVQLFNKTNQLNLSTRRLTASEVADWAATPQHSLLAVSASDRFGDMGLVAVLGVEVVGSRGRLVDFILSCRIMGRRVEETMIHLAISEVARLGGIDLQAHYLPTSRNRPTLDVLRSAGLSEVEEHVFLVDCSDGIEKPDQVIVEFVK